MWQLKTTTDTRVDMFEPMVFLRWSPVSVLCFSLTGSGLKALFRPGLQIHHDLHEELMSEHIHMSTFSSGSEQQCILGQTEGLCPQWTWSEAQVCLKDHRWAGSVHVVLPEWSSASTTGFLWKEVDSSTTWRCLKCFKTHKQGWVPSTFKLIWYRYSGPGNWYRCPTVPVFVWWLKPFCLEEVF